jgi:tight adherence protein B
LSELLHRANSAVILLVAGLLVGILSCAVGLVINLIAEHRRLRRRLGRVSASMDKKDQARSKRAAFRFDTSNSSIGWFDVAIKRILPQPDKLRDRLAETGWRITSGEYILASLLTALVANYVISSLASFRPTVTILFSLSAGITLPHLAVKWMIGRRLNRFTALFPEAIDLMVRGIKSGLPIAETIKAIGQELPDPVGVEFRRITDSFKIGFTLDEALAAAAKRLSSPEFQFFVISLAVQQETGGNLAETLENLSTILRRRKQMKLKIRAMSSEARASSLIIGALPVIAFVGLLVFKPDYMMPMVTDPRGHLFLAASVFSMLLGGGIMMRMAKFEI